MPHPSLYLLQTPDRGWGVFTRDALPAELVVEDAVVLPMSAADRIHLDQTSLHDYIFEWHPEGVPGCCLALGWLSLFNHSYTANCEYAMDYEAATMRIETVRPVTAGEELTINYNGDWNDGTPVWFEVR